MSTITIPQFDEQDHLHDENVKSIHQYNGLGFDPTLSNLTQRNGSLIVASLLRSTDSLTYTSHEFENRHMPSYETVTVALGGEEFQIEITEYGYKYMLNLQEGAPAPTVFDSKRYSGKISPHQWTDTCHDYGDVDPNGYIACISHTAGVRDFESPELWKEIHAYLKDGILPTRYKSTTEQKHFLSQTRPFLLHDECLWKLGNGGKPP